MKPRCYAAAGLFVLSLSTLGGCSNRENAEKDVTKTSAPALANPQAAAPPADTKDSLQDPASVSAVAPKSVTLADDAEKKSLAEGLEVEKAAADAAKSSQPANTFAATPYQPQAQFKSSASGSFGSRMARGYAGSSQANKSMYSIAPSVPPLATYNPNMYVSDTYIGGNGEKDRIEKLINAGVLVDGKRVKLEAFSHNYAQSFPIPTTMALDVTADTVHGKLLQQGGRTFLQIGLQAMKGEMPRRAPLNIALVIDRSGSMGDEHKLDYAKAAATKLLDSLAPTDTFTLVVFDDQAQVLVPAQHVTNRAHIRNQIAALQPGGSTNIYDGLKLAYSQVGKFVNTDSVNRVILLSDGEVTAGVQDAQQFHHLAAANVDADIQTSAVGVGWSSTRI